MSETMTSGDLTIRPLSAAELPGLTALLATQLREHHVTLSDLEIARAAAGMLVRPQRGQFLLAFESGALVGFAALSFLWSLEHGGRAVWLDELYVLPERRGHGIGATLLDAALEAARQAGATALDLEIEADHARAASLYRRAGFAPLDRTRWARRIEPIRRAPVAPPADLRGGCFCGAIRYRIAEQPRRISHCHCSICRRTSGAAFVTWLTLRAGAFSLTCGVAAQLQSTPKARRTFCAACGTPLTFQLTADPTCIDVTVASLDAPNLLAPDEHIWTASQLGWLQVDDDLPRYQEEAPRHP
jgi:GNAT superfamily N-acetyltransferase